MRARPILREPPAEARLRLRGAALLGGVLTLLWAWWALDRGGFFGSALYPGLALLLGSLVVCLLTLPLRLRPGWPHEVALLALGALALWTIVSLAWTPARDQALEDGFRTAAYLAATGSGLWFVTLLRERMLLAFAPLVLAGALVAIVTTVQLTAADPASIVDVDGTLEYPFGYRNATAGFFGVLAVASLAIAADPGVRTVVRAPLTGLATLALCLAVLCQSRGATLAILLGVAVMVAASRRRGTAVAVVGMTLPPLALALPLLLEPFDAAGQELPLAPELGRAAAASVLAAMAAATAAWISLPRIRRAGLEGRLPSLSRRTRVVAVVLAGGVVLAAGALAIARVSEEASLEYGPVDGSRLTYAGGLARSDYWRVALDQFREAPLLGRGAGSFRSDYLPERRTDEQPRDAHGIPFELLGELGLPGLLLLALAIAALVAGAIHSRRLGPRAATLSAGALGGGTVWLAQASIDWSMAFPGLTAPALALLASAGAPAALSLAESASRGTRLGLAAGLGLIALTAIPLYASERATYRAAADWPADRAGAYEALEVAADLNPLTDVPLLAKADIARRTGDPDTALDAVERAIRREPVEWRAYYLGARVLRDRDPRAALRQAELSLERYPGQPGASRLAERLRHRLAEGPSTPP